MKDKDKWISDYIEEYRRVYGKQKRVEIIRYGSYYQIIINDCLLFKKFKKSNILCFISNLKKRCDCKEI